MSPAVGRVPCLAAPRQGSVCLGPTATGPNRLCKPGNLDLLVSVKKVGNPPNRRPISPQEWPMNALGDVQDCFYDAICSSVVLPPRVSDGGDCPPVQGLSGRPGHGEGDSAPTRAGSRCLVEKRNRSFAATLTFLALGEGAAPDRSNQSPPVRVRR